MPIVIPPHCPKAPDSHDRCVSLAQTAARIDTLRRRFAITRLGDTTLLDRTGIPTATAIVPASPDLISVYNGKGTSLTAAFVGAIMEAVERQVTAAPSIPTFLAPVREVARTLNLAAMGLRDDALAHDVPCVWGTDLFTGEEIAVPLACVQCPWFGQPLFDITSTNGLASGNTLVEALFHALCEMIERHVWALHHARSRLLPQTIFGEGTADRSSAREVQQPTGNAVIDELAQRLEREGLALRLLWLKEGTLPHVTIASVYDRHLDPPLLHMGFGCSLSPEHAFVRAITEAIQCRVGDMQAAREDLRRPDDPKTGTHIEHARRTHVLPHGAWFFDAPARDVVAFESMQDRSSHDLATDLRDVIGALRDIGVSRAVAVDMTPGETEFSVARTIVPELETLMIDGRLGRWTSAILNPFETPP